jgi:NAD-dependent DNA ligase
MSGSNKLGAGIGEERIKIILDKYPNLLLDYKKWSTTEFINKLKELNGWEEKTSSLFVNNFNKFIKFYNEIKDYITIEEVTKNNIIKNIYSDKNIVISGFRDSQLQTFLENSGAKITNSVSKNTDLLIIKDEETIILNTGKVKKALELGINIITKNKIKY